MPCLLFPFCISPPHTELNPFLTVYVSSRVDAPVLHQLLFHIHAGWVQRADGKGCFSVSLHSHGRQSDKEPYSIHFHIVFLECLSCNIQPDHIFPLHASSITTLTSTEEAELSPLTASTRVNYLMYLLWNSFTDVRACSLGQSIYEIRHPHNSRETEAVRKFRDSTQRDHNRHQLLSVTFSQKVFPIPYAKRQQYLLAIKD